MVHHLSSALANAGALEHFPPMFRRPFPFAAAGALLTLLVPPAAAQQRVGPDLFRLARQIECQELPTQGLRQLILSRITERTTLVWPKAPLVLGRADASRLLDAQPLLDISEFGCQLLLARSAADTSLGVAGMLLTLRRRFPDTTQRFGRAMAAWRRVEGAWRLELFAPLNIFDLREIVVPDSLAPPKAARLLTPGSATLLAADSSLARAVSAGGLADGLAQVLLPDAVAFPSSGELHIGPVAITDPMTTVPTDWTWTPLVASVSDDASIGWTAGNVDAIRHREGRSPATIYAKYVAFWRRVDGTWRMFMLGTSPR